MGAVGIGGVSDDAVSPVASWSSCGRFAASELLPQRIFEYGSTYDLQVSYPGGQTGILTLLYNDELSVLDYSGGDRDGGDVNG
ncbi:MAG TPA: hypothetical protein VHP54_00540, partial [Caproiciproducens sp.]|nr:hypothetical protein [Caproiciproducens sp.]